MSAHETFCRVAIVGASSLRGKELKQVLEERGFPTAEVRLLDEDAIGTLAEAGGEATFIQRLEEDSFEGVRFAFFAGDAGFTTRHWAAAHRAGATVIDLSGALVSVPAAVLWIPSLDAVLSPPTPAVGKLFCSPSAAAMIGCTVAAVLAPFPVARLALVFFQPVSERGQAGVDELEEQTVKLLSFQAPPQDVYDAQVAFNLLARYGAGSHGTLADVRAGIARSITAYLAGRAPLPAVQLVQAPVFYACAFTAFLELRAPQQAGDFLAAFGRAGVSIVGDDDAPLSNVSVAGGNQIVISKIELDANLANAFWLWGAADNVRLPAVNAVAIAERLLAI